MKINHELAFSLIVTAAILFSACKQSSYSGKDGHIKSVQLTSGGCFGPCQRTITYLDSNLVFKFYGDEISFSLPAKARKEYLYGFYKGNINREFWDSLTTKLENIQFRNLDTVYAHSVDDQSFDLIIHYDDTVKYVRAHDASLPDKVRKVIYWIAESHKKINLKASKDTAAFENIRRIPKTRIDTIRLPPTSD